MAKQKRKSKRNLTPLWWVIFIAYIGIMVWLLFGRSRGWVDGLTYRQMLTENINLKPFYTIDNYINIIAHYPQSNYFRHCIINLFGNILVFIPAGWLIPRLFPTMRKFFAFFFTVLIAIVFVELLQLFTLLGHLDVDDIILNLTGMMIGYIFYAITAKT